MEIAVRNNIPAVPIEDVLRIGDVFQNDEAPEKKLIGYAFWLAIVEKCSSRLANFNFIWATVLLVGFAATLKTKDLWFVIIIVLIEGSRGFRQTRELQWQRQTGSTSTVLFSRCLLLSWLPVLTSVVLAAYRLASQDYGTKSVNDTNNQILILTIFYALSLPEALLYLAAEACSVVMIPTVITLVNTAYDFDACQVGLIRDFFYNTYSYYIDKSFLDDSKIKFVSYIVSLLQSNDVDIQLKAARVVSQLVKSRFAGETLRAIRTRPDVVERLVMMLDDPREAGIFAAGILENLFDKDLDRFNFRDKTGIAAQVVNFVFGKRDEHQEAAIGLAARFFLSLTHWDFALVLEELSAVKRRLLIWELTKAFWRPLRPSNEFHNIRRDSFGLLDALLKHDNSAMEMKTELSQAFAEIMKGVNNNRLSSTYWLNQVYIRCLQDPWCEVEDVVTVDGDIRLIFRLEPGECWEDPFVNRELTFFGMI